MTWVYPIHERSIGNWAVLGPVARDARSRAGLTQKDLAELAGVSRGWLIRFETGLPNAEPITVLRVLRVLELELVVRPRGGVPGPGLRTDEGDLDLDAYVNEFTDARLTSGESGGLGEKSEPATDPGDPQ